MIFCRGSNPCPAARGRIFWNCFCSHGSEMPKVGEVPVFDFCRYFLDPDGKKRSSYNGSFQYEKIPDFLERYPGQWYHFKSKKAEAPKEKPKIESYDEEIEVKSNEKPKKKVTKENNPKLEEKKRSTLATKRQKRTSRKNKLKWSRRS